MCTRVNERSADRLSGEHRDGNVTVSSGFSLIELLVVVAILAILAAIAIPLFLNQKSKSYDAVLLNDMHSLIMEMETAKNTAGSYTSLAAVSASLNTGGWKTVKPNWVEVWPNCAINAGGTQATTTPGQYIIRGYPKTVGAWSIMGTSNLAMYESSTGEWIKIPYNGTNARWNVMNSATAGVNGCQIVNGGIGSLAGWWQDNGVYSGP